MSGERIHYAYFQCNHVFSVATTMHDLRSITKLSSEDCSDFPKQNPTAALSFDADLSSPSKHGVIGISASKVKTLMVTLNRQRQLGAVSSELSSKAN